MQTSGFWLKLGCHSKYTQAYPLLLEVFLK